MPVEHGIKSLHEFQNDVKKVEEIEILKGFGLDEGDIKLYQQHEKGEIRAHKNMESTLMKNKLKSIYKKIENFKEDETINNAVESLTDENCKDANTIGNDIGVKPNVYLEHPINNIKELENDMFGYISFDQIESLTKRRKLLRRLKRKEDSSLFSDTFLADAKSESKGHSVIASTTSTIPLLMRNKKSLWDIKDVSKMRNKILPPIQTTYNSKATENKELIGPKPKTIYKVKNNKIVRLEPMARSDDKLHTQTYRAVELKVPINKGEERLLERSQLDVDDIKNIPKFKDYERGLPTKVLFVKNISPRVREDDLQSLLNNFAAENGTAIDIRILSGRMRGQAFVHFTNEAVCAKALKATNGVILKGKPIIVQFGKTQVEKKSN